MKDDSFKPKRGIGLDFTDLDKITGAGKLPGDVVRQVSLADEIRRARGGFPETATDRMLRDMREGSSLERAVKDALGSDLTGRLASLYPKPSVTERAITKAQAEMAGLIGGFSAGIAGKIGSSASDTALEAVRKQTNIGGAIGRLIETDPAVTLGRTIGSGIGASLATRYADANLASSVAGLQRTYEDRYQGILRQVTGIGSLGSIVAGLATRQKETFGRSSRLFDDIAGRIGGRSAASMSDALRRAHADLMPPLRPARRSEIDMLVEVTRGWKVVAPHQQWMERARDGMTGLTAAWVREDRPELSLEAMARFAHLGGVVANLDPREAVVTAELRARLGDYRGEDISDRADDDPLLRVAEQYDRGFDPVLSSLPTKVLIAMLAPFGLRFDAAAADDEFGLQDLVGQMVRRLEARLMNHVRVKLEDAYGDTWIEQVPSDVRYQLRRRRRKDEEEGRPPSDLIAYADWAWWGSIINHGDNWRLFAPAFGSFDVLSETLARLRPIRHAASHPRTVGPEDLVLLAADGLWLLRCIGAVH